MHLNGSSKAWADIVAKRREEVARLRLRGYSTREICQGMKECNPRNGKPWSLGSIHNDITYLEQQWQAAAASDTLDLKARLLAELREVRRKAWQDSDLNIILKSLAQEAKLLGLDAPAKIDVTHQIIKLAEELGLDPEEAIVEAERIIKAIDGN